jgi:O-antigen/teichoic acid export membrane protein
VSAFNKLLLGTFTAQFFGLVCGFFATVILARALGPTMRGELALFMASVSVLAVTKVVFVGGNHILLNEDRSRLKSLVWLSYFSALSIGLASMLLLYANVGLCHVLLGTRSLSLIGCLALTLLLTCVLESLNQLLSALQEISFLNRTASVFNFGYLVLLAALLYYYEPSVHLAIYAYLIRVFGELLTLQVKLFYVGAFQKTDAGGGVSLIRESLRLGVKGLGLSVGVILILKSDLWQLAYWGNPHLVGIYQVAVGLCGLFWTVSNKLGYLIRTKALVEEDGELRTLLIAQLIFYAGLLAWPFVILFGKMFIGAMYGSDYIDAATVCSILWGAVVFWAVATTLGSIMSIRQRIPLWIVVCLFSALALNVGLNSMLIPSLGIRGAAYASLAAYAFVAIWHILKFAHFYEVTALRLLIPDFECLKLKPTTEPSA